MAYGSFSLGPIPTSPLPPRPLVFRRLRGAALACFLSLPVVGPFVASAQASAPADARLRSYVIDCSEALSGELPLASAGSGLLLPEAETRLALTDGASRFVLSASGAEGRVFEVRAGLSSTYALVGPLELSGLARFLLDPAGEGFRLTAPDGSPFSLDASLESSRLGLALGGDAFGAGAWVPAGEAPVLTVWLNASPARAASYGLLAWRFVETGPSTRNWVDAEAVAAGGPALALAFHASLARASSRASLAAGFTDALRGPEGAAFRLEAGLRSGPFGLEAAAAARSGAWSTPTGRQGAALLLRADLSFEPSDFVVLDARLVSSSEEGGGSELDLALDVEASPGPWRIALGFTREGPARDPPRLGAEFEAGFDGGALEADFSCLIGADLADLASALADADSLSLRLVPSVAFKTVGLALSAAFALELPLALVAPPGLEASLGATLPLAGGALSASLGFAAPSNGTPEAAWNLSWKRRVKVGGA